MTQRDQQRVLGASGLEISPLGLGTNRWGSKRKLEIASIVQTYQAALDAGLTFFDTAEVYMGGESERLLGACIARDQRPVVVASKFAPLPNRLSPHSLMDALDASLSRMNLETIDLYHVYWPYTLLRIDALMDMLALAVRTGKIRAVGVSNFSAHQMRQAAARLAHYGIPLASNEVHYSLLHRAPEANGVLDACRELNVALIAYRPLEGGQFNLPASSPAPLGLLAEPAEEPIAAAPSSRARPGLLPALRRKGSTRQEQRQRLDMTMQKIARAHQSTASQVALAWLLRRDPLVIPIPGSITPAHALENIGALDLPLSTEEFVNLETASLPWKRV